MPLNTTMRSYPYPVDGDLVDVAADMERLADAVDVDAVQKFTSVAARNAWIPPGPGAACSVNTGASSRFYVWDGTVWYEPGALTYSAPLGAMNGIAGEVVITNSGFTMPSARRRYEVSIQAHFFKVGALGDVNLRISAGAPVIAADAWTIPSPGRMTCSTKHHVLGSATTGGAWIASASAGGANLEYGWVRVMDVGGQ